MMDFKDMLKEKQFPYELEAVEEYFGLHGGKPFKAIRIEDIGEWAWSKIVMSRNTKIYFELFKKKLMTYDNMLVVLERCEPEYYEITVDIIGKIELENRLKCLRG